VRPHDASALALRPARAGAALLFGALTLVRRRRIFHPDGALFAAELRVLRGAHAALDWDLLRRPRRFDALVRLSRGAGLPEPLVDHLGIALRVVDAYGRGRHQDLLLGASSPLPVGRHLLLPARGYLRSWYSTVLPYRARGRRVVLGAQPLDGGAVGDDPYRIEPHGDGTPAWRILAASLTGGWQPIAELRLERRLPDARAEALRFNPWNTGGGLEPSGLLNALRDSAYRSSQAARSAR
jgi:hypothetical protein